MSSDTISTPQVNYRSVSQTNPKYRFLRLNMSNKNGTSFSITATTSDLIEFKLPSNCVYNLSESFFSYQVAPDAQAHYTYLNEDCLDIATNAFFGTASGQDICNLNYVNRYTKIARRINTKMGDFLAQDNSSQLYACNSLAAVNIAPVLTSTMNYIESQYYKVSVDTAAVVGNRLFPLKGITDTVFSVNKDLYIPQDMYIRFTAGIGNQISFFGTSGTVPATGHAAIVGNITFNNVYLYLAVEQNELIKASVINKVMTQGLRLNIPYTTSFRNSTNSTVGNIQLQLTQQYGKKLKKILHSVWSGTESLETALDCSNYNGSKIVSYNTFMDNKQLQDAVVSTLIATIPTPDDFRENNRFIQDSVIMNKSVYAQTWFHLDQFYENNGNTAIPEENLYDGLDMDHTRLWQIQSTCANVTLNHYTFATFIRPAIITSTGIMFEN